MLVSEQVRFLIFLTLKNVFSRWNTVDEQWLTSSQIAEVIEVILVAADGTA